MSNRHSFFTPVGRFVSGSLTEKRTTDSQNKPIPLEKQRIEFGIAIGKTDPNFAQMVQGIMQFAKAEYAAYPAVSARIDAWFTTLSGFSMKISDGDSPNSKGQVNQNTAGHFVIWFSTQMDILAANAQNTQIDIGSIKRGWFVDVSANVSINGLTDHNAGIYMNPVCVRLIAEGDEILGGVSIEAALANAPAAPASLPPGARPVGSTPAAPVTSGAPGTGLGGVGGNPTQTPAHTGLPGSGQPASAGLPGMGAATPVGSTASPGDTYPAHPGVLGGGTLPV